MGRAGAGSGAKAGKGLSFADCTMGVRSLVRPPVASSSMHESTEGSGNAHHAVACGVKELPHLSQAYGQVAVGEVVPGLCVCECRSDLRRARACAEWAGPPPATPTAAPGRDSIGNSCACAAAAAEAAAIARQQRHPSASPTQNTTWRPAALVPPAGAPYVPAQGPKLAPVLHHRVEQAHAKQQAAPLERPRAAGEVPLR